MAGRAAGGEWKGEYNGDMLPRRARLTAIFLLLTCVLCPVIESLDMWHPAFDDGNDTEFALVIAALCVGVGYMTARLVLKSERAGSSFSSILANPFDDFFAFVPGFHSLQLAATSPPVLALRI